MTAIVQWDHLAEGANRKLKRFVSRWHVPLDEDAGTTCCGRTIPPVAESDVVFGMGETDCQPCARYLDSVRRIRAAAGDFICQGGGE